MDLPAKQVPFANGTNELTEEERHVWKYAQEAAHDLRNFCQGVFGTACISTAFLSAIETGRKEPSVEFLAKCADVFEISLSALVLLSESYEKAKADGAGKAFIKKAMHSIICLLSKGCDDE